MRRNRTDAEIAVLGSRNLLGRVADPAELASIIVFLAGDGASYLMGETVRVDGGRLRANPPPAR
jgi:NAD(P)-dependent dehydrogenase (short-subunit alcohol dehydrogenase family)